MLRRLLLCFSHCNPSTSTLSLAGLPFYFLQGGRAAIRGFACVVQSNLKHVVLLGVHIVSQWLPKELGTVTGHSTMLFFKHYEIS